MNNKAENASRKGRPHARNLRKGRVSIPGQVYVVTVVTKARNPVFADFLAARKLVNILRNIQESGNGETLCFVIMPDHFHWLIQLGGTMNLSCLIQGVKSRVSKQLGRKIWQRGFYDHALRQEEDVRTVARYIVANPLRAGLVDKINDYPHWDAVWL